jgi:hypothetical protein
MWSYIAFIIGLIIGLTFKKIVLNWLKKSLIVKRNRYLIKFHAYFVLHQSGSRLNEVIKTNTVEVSIISKNTEDAIGVVKQIITNETRIEIESIEEDVF